MGIPANKPATINRLMATIKHMFHKGYQWEMCGEETLKRVRQVKLLEENNRRLRYLSREECAELVSKCKDVTGKIVMAALNTGMRKGEILSLKWENVDMKHGLFYWTGPRTESAEKFLSMRILKAVLQSLTRQLDVPYVFFDTMTGKPYQDVKRSFSTACRQAGIHDFHFHDLRHTFASHLIMAGADITTVSNY